MKHITSSSAIENAGGTKVVSRLCDVSSQAVSRWRKKGIPPAQLRYLKILNPQIFGGVEYLRGTRKAA